ncbi:layilin-like protein [Dinothrombium tinctorium]|uniref:Layilin-like protein n=1 Tax=Dinothrombium tinctorium TaxID=1965070 RepID=A0A3S3P135_9ACAR|nr:layilin-like protein [Dinothrombium tinctorium]RWS05604.1 layilin-like protein [Dinothrombium tinctorium]RWS05799.1 layilin-like protein [Dinothrombium tinctorium]
MNASMVTIKNIAENNEIDGLTAARGEFWLGAVHLLGRPKEYVWIDGTNVSFTKWSNSQPNEEDNFCVAVVIDNGFWWDRLCDAKRKQICRKAFTYQSQPSDTFDNQQLNKFVEEVKNVLNSINRTMNSNFVKLVEQIRRKSNSSSSSNNDANNELFSQLNGNFTNIANNLNSSIISSIRKLENQISRENESKNDRQKIAHTSNVKETIESMLHTLVKEARSTASKSTAQESKLNYDFMQNEIEGIMRRSNIIIAILAFFIVISLFLTVILIRARKFNFMSNVPTVEYKRVGLIDEGK